VFFYHARPSEDKENKNLHEEISLRKNNRGRPARRVSSIFIDGQRNNATTIAASGSRYSVTLAIA
jgi:hypothetical protein